MNLFLNSKEIGMKNILGREVPDFIEGYGSVRHYEGAFARAGKPSKRAEVRIHKGASPGGRKLCESLGEALDKLPLRDGMTVSFHHHLRNGDFVTNMVMEEIGKRGYKDIHVAASGLFACHGPLVPLIEDGTITQISVSTFGAGPVPQAISAGKLKKPVILRSHGGRPRAIENGEMHIDIAFIASPSCDVMGNINGSQGKSACGCLSYSYADAEFADYVVAVTDTLVPYPNTPAEISQNFVDYVAVVDAGQSRLYPPGYEFSNRRRRDQPGSGCRDKGTNAPRRNQRKLRLRRHTWIFHPHAGGRAASGTLGCAMFRS